MLFSIQKYKFFFFKVWYKDLFYLTFSYSLKLTDLLLTALENPVTYIEDNVEQKVNLPV